MQVYVWLWHELRDESLLHDINEGRMRGKVTRCRKRMHLLSNLIRGKYVALKTTAEDRKEWQKLHNKYLHHVCTCPQPNQIERFSKVTLVDNVNELRQ